MMLSTYSKWRILRRKLKYIRWEKPMQRPERFEIEFDAPGKVYFSDDIVAGKVVLKISEPLHLKGVKMRFKGECSFHFCETKKILRRSKRKKLLSGNKIKDIERDIKEIKGNTSIMTDKSKGYYYSNGVDNPGFIKDENRSTEPKVKFSTKFPEHSIPNGQTRNFRPKSTENIWNEKLKNGPTHHYQAFETYFDCEFYIYGHKYQHEEKEMLPVGTHLFPFAFNLPPNLPPSFSSERGIIRYMAAAVLDRPSAANLVRKTGFTLQAVHDLNMNSHSTSSCSKSKSVNTCGICCDSGPINLSLRIPKRGYVPGESITVNAEVDNISGRYTKRTRLSLSQVITFIMPNKLKTHVEERTIREIVRGTLPPGETDFWENVTLLIPPLPSNNVHINCRLMHLDYKLEMVVELPKPWKDLKVTIPIIIGNIPLRSTFKSFQPSNSSEEQRKFPGIKYNDFPSFTYGECFFGEELLEKQYERITGDSEHMGPQYIEETPFAPVFFVYTPGNNLPDINLGPSTSSASSSTSTSPSPLPSSNKMESSFIS